MGSLLIIPSHTYHRVTPVTSGERIICGDSKKFTDCFTGFDYFTTQSLLDPFNSELLQGYVYEVIVNGEKICAIYDGLVQNISGIDNIEITGIVGNSSEGACLDCIVVTPTPVYNCLVVHSECTTGGTGTINVNPGTIINGRPSYTFSLVLLVPYTIFSCTIYWDDINVRWVVEDSTNNIAGAYLYSDIPTPIGSVSEWISQPISIPTLNCITTSAGFYTTELTVPCPSPSVTPTVTPSFTPQPSLTPSITPSVTPSQTPGNSISPTPSITISRTPSTTPPSPENLLYIGTAAQEYTSAYAACLAYSTTAGFPYYILGGESIGNGTVLYSDSTCFVPVVGDNKWIALSYLGIGPIIGVVQVDNFGVISNSTIC